MADKEIVAVVGSTGAQGGSLCEAILGDPSGGFACRAVTRDPEKDKADLKRGFGELADQLDFDVLLLAHGTPYPSGGRDALRAFAER